MVRLLACVFDIDQQCTRNRPTAAVSLPLGARDGGLPDAAAAVQHSEEEHRGERRDGHLRPDRVAADHQDKLPRLQVREPVAFVTST